MSEHVVDARHLLCPMPVIKTQQAVADFNHGDRFILVCTDPGVQYDVPAWLRLHGHRLLRSNCGDG